MLNGGKSLIRGLIFIGFLMQLYAFAGNFFGLSQRRKAAQNN
jgi:hypothetical protein